MMSFADPDPYLVKRTSDNNFRYEFYTTDKKVTARKNKTYFWFKGGAVHYAESGIGGLLLDGKFTKMFHSNQLAEQGYFENGLKKGTWKTWYSNGTIETTQYWSGGLRVGSYYRYSQAGEVLEAGNYRNNKRHGKWIDHVKKDTVEFRRGNVFVKKQKLTKEEKLKFKEEKIKLREDKKEADKAEKVAKKNKKEAAEAERQDKRLLKKTMKADKKANPNAEKPNFFKRLIHKKDK